MPSPDPELLPAPEPTPATATVAQARSGEVAHFENMLGMRFVPVPRTAVLFSVWEARVQDCRVFAEETRREWARREWHVDGFEQRDDQEGTGYR